MRPDHVSCPRTVVQHLGDRSPGVAVVGFAVLAIVALGTSLVPALRAGRVDLVRVLKAE